MGDEKIIIDENICAGKPVVKGTRLSVDFVLDLLANGWSYDTIIENYPQLTLDTIRACLEYASQVIKDEKVVAL